MRAFAPKATILIICLFASDAFSNPRIDFINVSSQGSAPPESVLKERALPFERGIQNVKLSLAFSEVVSIGRVQIESCNDEFLDGAEFFLHPFNRRFFSEGGRKDLKVTFPPDEGLRTLAVHFGFNDGFCIDGIKFFDRAGKMLKLTAPIPLQSSWVSSFKTPELFDSRPDTAFKFGEKTPDLKFSFAEEVKITGLKVWNGDQWNLNAFKESPKPSKIVLQTDANEPLDLKLSEDKGVQEFRFPKLISARNIRLRFPHRGAISEIRFITPDGDAYPWFAHRLQWTSVGVPKSRSGDATRPLSSLGEQAQRTAIDREFASLDEAEGWIFRFRSDGTFFVKGRVDQAKTAGKFIVSGRYELLEKRDKYFKFKVHGMRRQSPIPWDGWECDIACGEKLSRPYQNVSDLLVIESVNKNWIVRNRSPIRQRGLPFTDLRLKISSLSD